MFKLGLSIVYVVVLYIYVKDVTADAPDDYNDSTPGLCSPNLDLPDESRNGCNSDEDCKAIGRAYCDGKPECYGIAYYSLDTDQSLKLCGSTTTTPNDGWLTMLKKETTTTQATTIKTTTKTTTTNATTITTTTKATTKKPSGDDCMDVVVDMCPDISDHIIMTLPDVENWLTCQNLCDNVYEADCKYLMYKEREQECTIFGNTYEDYIELCDAFGGGHHTPSGCLRDDTNYPNRCKFMLQGECDFQGNVILSSINIIDPEECLELSETFKGDYYYHDATTEMCKVYDNRSRNCNIQRSLRGAVTDGCQGEN